MNTKSRAVRLRTKLLVVTVMVFFLLAAGTGISLYQERQVMAFVEKTNTYVTWMMTTLSSEDQSVNEVYRQYYEESQRAHRAAWYYAIGMLVISLLVSLALGAYFVRRITRPLTRFVNAMTAVANGDLTVHVDVETNDEIGQAGNALNNLVRSLNESMTKVLKTATAVNEGSSELKETAAYFSDIVQQQASAVEETAAAMEEMTGTVKTNAENAVQADNVAATFRNSADESVAVVGSIVDSMEGISESSQKISAIISVIDGIAFQTNLLALNAAVEAARAGEHGRGFSVVAAEVRTLAQRVAGAAKEIKTLITHSKTKIDQGSSLVTRSGKTLKDVAASVKQIAGLITDISAANREQASGIDQVNDAIAQIESSTQTSASQAEELTATSESLAEQAAQLKALVARFKIENNLSPAPELAAVHAGRAKTDGRTNNQAGSGGARGPALARVSY